MLCCAVMQDRSLQSCLQQLFQQHLSQQQPQHNTPILQPIRSQHSQGWQISGAVLTAPSPALCTKQHQLLYVNSRAAVCPVLAQLLRDWFVKHVKTLTGKGAAAGKVSCCNALHVYDRMAGTAWSASQQQSSSSCMHYAPSPAPTLSCPCPLHGSQHATAMCVGTAQHNSSSCSPTSS